MKNRIETVLAEIRKTMQGQLLREEFDSVSTSSLALARARQLQKQLEKDERELMEIEKVVKSLSSGANGYVPIPQDAARSNFKSSRAEPQTIRIKIDWKANKRSRDKEEIHSPIAAEVITEFVARLVEEFGKDVLQTLSEQVRANRAPLLSRSPVRDFGGYGKKQIRGTDWYLLTHSSTPEKVELLKKICHVLGLVPGSIEIKAEGRFGGLA